MPRKIITEELKQEIIKYYLSQPMTMKHVEDKYELSHPTMTKILKDILVEQFKKEYEIIWYKN